MRTWEYKLQRITWADMETALNGSGALGWELVHMIPMADTTRIAIFKRPLWVES